MNIYCGVDIIEIERIKESIENLGDAFLKRIYTQDEIEYCENKKVQRYQHYAARFAAKEAAFKAVSNLLKDKYDVTWQDLIISNDENGRPNIHINNLDYSNIQNIDVSISHNRTNVVANVVILTK